MAEEWHAIYETSTGRLMSIGTVVGSSVRGNPNLTDKVLSRQPLDSEEWDESSRDFVARANRPVRDLATEISQEPDIAHLSASDKSSVETASAKVLDRDEVRFQ